MFGFSCNIVVFTAFQEVTHQPWREQRRGGNRTRPSLAILPNETEIVSATNLPQCWNLFSPEVLKFVLKLLGLVFTMTESPLVLGRVKMWFVSLSLVRLSTQLTQLSTSRILTSLELAASGASLLLRYSRAELINTNFVSGRWISGELTAEIPVKETHYVIQESSLSYASVVF